MPANANEPPDDDVAEIAARVEAIPDQPLFVKANYNLYFMVRGAYTEYPFADVPITGTASMERQRLYAEFIAHAPDDIRALLALVVDWRTRALAAEAVLAEAQANLEDIRNAVELVKAQQDASRKDTR